MKKVFNFLKKCITIATLCLLITTTITPLPIPNIDNDSEYGTCVIPGSDDDEPNPFGDEHKD